MTSKSKKAVYLILTLIIVGLIIWRLVENKKHIKEQEQKTTVVRETSVPVGYIVASFSNTQNELMKTGTLLAYREADINAISGGKLVGVNFNLGSYVSQGRVLARVDNEALRLNLNQAQLQRDRAAKDVKRFKVLVEGNAATQLNLDDAQLQLDNANAQINILKRQSTDNAILAPISGQVVTKLKEQGEYVSPGAVLGHIVDISRLKAAVMVNEADVYGLKLGSKVKISTDVYPGVTYDGTITFISQQADGAHNYQVEVTMNNTGANKLKAGTFVTVDFSKPFQAAMMLIPRSAFYDGLKQPKVYVVENDRSIARKVVIGKEFGDSVEVVSGLTEGDKVIVNGQINLKDSALVASEPLKQ